MFNILWILIVFEPNGGWSQQIAVMNTKEDCAAAIIEMEAAKSFRINRRGEVVERSVSYACTPKPIYKRD